jgi:hypothetical protein
MKKEKELTISDLANKIDQGFKANDSKFADLTKTIDDLASATADGFLRVEKRFESIDKRFESIDQRFDRVDSELKLVRSEMHMGFQKSKMKSSG